MTESPYVPTIPADEVERLRRLHELSYQNDRRRTGDGQTVEYGDLTFVVPPEVHPLSPLSHLLGDAVLAEVREGDRVLDMGTGCGLHAVLAATRGADVVAVDLNPHAVEATRENAARNGVADRVRALESDVFSAVDGTFDVIVFNPPFRWFAARDALELASADAGYRALTSFFRNAGRHLRPGGRMLMFFGTSGDVDYLQRLAAEEAFVSQTVASHEVSGDGWRVEYFTFRLTR